MHDLSPTEGFVQVHESLTEMIKHAANEPSVGLFFVQQHVHKVVPILVSLKGKVVGTTQDSFLCTEDMEDATNSVKLMKECTPPIIERMMKNLNSSISVMSSVHQLKGKRRFLGRPAQFNLSGKGDAIQTMWSSPLHKGGNASWGSCPSGLHQVGGNDGEINSITYDKCDESTETLSRTNLGSSSSSFRSVFKRALQRAGTFGKSRTNMKNASDISVGMLATSSSAGPLKDIAGSISSQYGYAMDSPCSTTATVEQEGMIVFASDLDNSKEMEADKCLPISSLAVSQSDYASEIWICEDAPASMVPKSSIEAFKLSDNFGPFQSKRAAKLEMWLTESDDGSTSSAHEHDSRPTV